jgi:hypothetical protein
MTTDVSGVTILDDAVVQTRPTVGNNATLTQTTLAPLGPVVAGPEPSGPPVVFVALLFTVPLVTMATVKRLRNKPDTSHP